MSLSSGLIERIRNDDDAIINEPLVVQVMAIKGIEKPGFVGPERYRLNLFDGINNMWGMLATQLKYLVVNEQIMIRSIIRITEYTSNLISGQKVLILMQVEIVETNSPNISSGYLMQQSPTRNVQSLPNPPQQQTYGNPPQANYNPQSVPQKQNIYGAQSSIPSYGSDAAPPQQSSKPNPYSNQSYGGQVNSRPIIRDEGVQIIITPISAINPYSNKWTIKARITAKTEIKRWSNSKGEGTLFSCDLLDNYGTEIRCTFFKEACDKFYPMLEEGKVYTFTQGQLKVVQNRQYTSIKNPYELTFDKNADIKPAQEDESIKSRHYDFTKINKIVDVDINTTIDIIGIVRSATDVASITSAKLGNKELFKRELTIADDSEAEIRLTIWGDKAQSNQYDWNSHPIVAFKGVKVGDFGGRSLSSLTSSSMQINPLIPEGQEIYNWKESKYGDGEMGPLTSLSTSGLSAGAIEPLENRKTISIIKDDALGSGEKPDWLSLKVYVINIKHDNIPWYPACDKCSKKVSESMGSWTCEKCIGHTMQEPIYRYVISCLVADHTGTNWVSMFNDQGEKLLGFTAKQLHQLKHIGNESEFEKVFKDAQFRSFVVKASVKQDYVNEEVRQKCTIRDLHTIDYVSECEQMIAAINKYN